MNIAKKYFFIPIIIIAAIVALYYWKNPLVPKLEINKTTFTYELAITPEQLTQGLSGRDPLPSLHGMLFVFDHEEQFKFWMKEMKFPLDLIWIDNKTVVDITKNAPIPVPGQNLPLYSPKKAVNRVLEVTAGTADQYNIKEGDSVNYLKR